MLTTAATTIELRPTVWSEKIVSHTELTWVTLGSYVSKYDRCTACSTLVFRVYDNQCFINMHIPSDNDTASCLRHANCSSEIEHKNSHGRLHRCSNRGLNKGNINHVVVWRLFVLTGIHL